MKFYCCECGRPVPVTDDGKIIGHCSRHPEALRTKKNWAGEWFAEMKRVVDATEGIGRVFHGTYGEPIQRMEIRGYVYGRGEL